jgi:hypothetical protein
MVGRKGRLDLLEVLAQQDHRVGKDLKELKDQLVLLEAKVHKALLALLGLKDQ